MSVTIDKCIEVMDRILAGHVLSTVDYKAMREASQLVKEYKERPNKVNRPDACECPQGSLCEFFKIEDESCLYGKI